MPKLLANGKMHTKSLLGVCERLVDNYECRGPHESENPEYAPTRYDCREVNGEASRQNQVSPLGLNHN